MCEVRSYQILDEDGQPLGYGCGPRPPTARDVEAVREFAATLTYEPAQCRCPHGDDWHGPGGCEARGCPCEVEPR